MRRDVANDLKDSAYDFQRVVWPAIADKCGGGELLPVEAVESPVMQVHLDQLGQVDAWQIRQADGLMRGLASRIQWDRNWKKVATAGWMKRTGPTFTIRKQRVSGAKTELEKGLRAVCGPGEHLYPGIHVHAYVQKPRRKGALFAVAIAYTKDLFGYIKQQMDDDPMWDHGHTRRNPDGNLFLWVAWDELDKAGHRVWTYQTEDDSEEVVCASSPVTTSN